MRDEPRVKLYDADLYLQSCINPDPFAATTTVDPFLASTMYLDAQAVDKHLNDFKKWLNALVSIPADLDAECNNKIDVGKLFNEVRQKELTLAPTKEEQSMHYLTKFRLESLRRAAIQLFLSEPMRVICSKVAVYVNKNGIRIRSDRNLHLDVVMQRYILELLLCFNPLWLRLGLEVVFGEQVHLTSNNDIVGLSTFILNRLFRDKFIEQKYSRAYALSEDYAYYIKKFTLQKILFLLLFLDKAKSDRIIKHNPCLFVKKSPYKETKDILCKFAAELLANLGDITRELKRFGYVLQHKQSYLDEFDYAFQNIAVDLRDGVRLTRVMEIILLRDDLTKQLRAPANSRLQRIYNVNLALRALSDADFQLKGDIKAADIVDGHREKTLSLLWQIIYKFRSPKFHAAARVLQNWWRRLWLRVIIKRRIRRKEELRREAAATKIQAAFRSHLMRRYVKVYREERNRAAVVLQKYIRGYLARTQFRRARSATLTIQRWYRAQILGRDCRQQFQILRNCTVFLQRCFRRRQLSRKLLLAVELAKLQIEQEKQAAATIIQTHWRCYFAMKNVRNHYLALRNSAIVLQRKYRARREMMKQRHAYVQLRCAAIVIQRRFRANKLMAAQRLHYLNVVRCVSAMQRRRRALLSMRAVRADYLKLRSSTICIQRKWRATLLARHTQYQYIRLMYYSTIVQQTFRGRKLMRVEYAYYQRLKVAVINVQRRFRATKQMQQQRVEFERKRQAVIIIQRRFRAYKEMRFQRAKYQGTKAATICIQQYMRGYILMKRERMRFLKIRGAALVLQRAFRARQCMRAAVASYSQLKAAAVLVQQRYRATLRMRCQRLIFQQQKAAAIVIQRRFRAKLLGQQIRTQYLEKREIIVKLQLRFRAKMLMCSARVAYLEKRTMIIKIQRYFRAHLAMKRTRKTFQAQRQAAVCLQRWYRSVLCMRHQQQCYQRLRHYTILVQRQWRANIAARQQRQLYLKALQKIVLIQRKTRATLRMRHERQQFQQLKTAAITLQNRYRARREMLKMRSQYLLIRSLIVCIQRKYRAHRAMQVVRYDFLLLKRTTIHLQQKYRGHIQMRVERDRFVQLQRSVLGFQSYARGFLARKRFQALMTPEFMELLRHRKAARIIQRFWRGYRVRSRFHSINLQLIRKNIALLKATSKAINSLSNQLKDAVRILNGHYSASEALNVLNRLARVSRTVPHFLEPYCSFITTFCYGIMSQAIRSESDKKLIENCCYVILNLARYDTDRTFQEGGLITVAQMLLRWCDKDTDIFNTLCTLIWIFAQCPYKRKIIREFMTTTEAIYLIRETKKLVARKEKMRQNVRNPNVTATPRNGQQQNFSSRALPGLEPDYGVIRNKPYIFISSVYAFDTILCKLGIDVF